MRTIEKTVEPEKVPTKLVNPIDYRLLVLIFCLVGGFQVYLYSLQDADKADSTISVISAINPLACSVMSFFVAKRYNHSEVFGKTYFVLGVAMLAVFLGEITYAIYDYYGMDPYPSIADVFFFAFYPLTFYHLMKNIRFFKPKIKSVTKILIILATVLNVTIYSILSFQKLEEANFDYYYGLFYVISAAAVLSTAVLGVTVFRQGVLGTAWLILTIGIALITFADSWYSYLETFDQYDLLHPVNLLWYSGYWILTYALYKHRDTI